MVRWSEITGCPSPLVSLPPPPFKLYHWIIISPARESKHSHHQPPASGQGCGRAVKAGQDCQDICITQLDTNNENTSGSLSLVNFGTIFCLVKSTGRFSSVQNIKQKLHDITSLCLTFPTSFPREIKALSLRIPPGLPFLVLTYRDRHCFVILLFQSYKK